MRKLSVLVASVLFVLTSCKDLTGSLNVIEAISLKNDNKDTVQIPVGSYRGAIKVNSKKKINLELNLANGKNTFVFKTDQNLKELKSGDRIQVSASTSGQPYDIDGTYVVNSSQSDVQRANETCTYYAPQFVCHERENQGCHNVQECDPNDASQCKDRQVCDDSGPQQTCGYEQVAQTGYHDVEYYYSTTTESVQLQLNANGKSFGQFNGSDSDSNKNYTYQADCR